MAVEACWKRAVAVERVKIEYAARGYAAQSLRARTPDPWDTTLSKRTFEWQMGQWRRSLRGETWLEAPRPQSQNQKKLKMIHVLKIRILLQCFIAVDCAG